VAVGRLVARERAYNGPLLCALSKDHRFPPERVELLQRLSQHRDIYDRLARAIAPSIYENQDIKKGILLQLFGGTKKNNPVSGRTHFR